MSPQMMRRAEAATEKNRFNFETGLAVVEASDRVVSVDDLRFPFYDLVSQ